MITKEEFNTLPDWKKRVVIAEDVLKYMDAGKLFTSSGCYTDFPGVRKYDDIGNSKLIPTNLQEYMLQEDNYCYACAIGSVFVAHIMRVNEFEINKYVVAGDSNIHQRIILANIPFFDQIQLREMELAYEQMGVVNSVAGLYDRDKEYYENYHYTERGNTIKSMYNGLNPNERLRAIMQNIIDNEGWFTV